MAVSADRRGSYYTTFYIHTPGLTIGKELLDRQHRFEFEGSEILILLPDEKHIGAFNDNKALIAARIVTDTREPIAFAVLRITVKVTDEDPGLVSQLDSGEPRAHDPALDAALDALENKGRRAVNYWF